MYSKIQLSPGADVLIKVLKRLGFRIGIISGGFTYFVDRLKQDLGVHYGYANVLEWDGDEITGRVQGVIVDARRKADLMELLAQQEGVLLDQVIAVGDGANDLQMLKKAGLGIAYNAKPITKSMVGTSITRENVWIRFFICSESPMLTLLKWVSADQLSASIFSIGTNARTRKSSGIVISGWRVSKAAATFSRVFLFI